jgi:competence protein ComEC
MRYSEFMKLRIGYLLSGITTGFILLLTFVWTQPDGRLHIVFCNVGQGDAVYVRFADGRDMLVDGGPDDKVLSCLGRHMPFWDRHIDIAVLSHPQKDHMDGLTSVFDRYTIGYFIRNNVDSSSEGFTKLVDVVKKKNITVKYVTAGDRIAVDTTSLSILWPSREQVALGKSQVTSDASGGLNVLGATDSELNDSCIVIAIRYGTFDALFPGDADSHVEAKYDQLQAFVDPVEVLKVPHHGSKTGMTQHFVDWVKPQVAVISVGKNNYGHPAQESINMLQDVGSRILRTDKEGDIEIISDGNNWKVR